MIYLHILNFVSSLHWHLTQPAGAAYLVRVLRENGSIATCAKGAQGKLSHGGPKARSNLPGFVMFQEIFAVTHLLSSLSKNEWKPGFRSLKAEIQVNFSYRQPIHTTIPSSGSFVVLHMNCQSPSSQCNTSTIGCSSLMTNFVVIAATFSSKGKGQCWFLNE